ncbi:MAG: hypothetical protein WD431_15385 [Cyclobacteriaceae bacterium]
MKTTTKKFDTVRFFRAEKERIAKEISNMSFEELKDYLKSKSAWLKKNKSRPHNNG